MRFFIHEKRVPGKAFPVSKEYDVVVVGGGMSGMCAALASARTGARTAIIQDRSVFGGNASSEIRMHICGASCHWGKKNALETGIVMELELENKYLNDSYNYSIWDGVLWSRMLGQENLDCYMNASMVSVDADGGHIRSITAYQMTTEQTYRLSAEIFIDATGLGTLSAFAGAECRFGTESSSEYGERSAPDDENGDTMGNTILFCAYDTGHPVSFRKPSWAYTFDESDFAYRYHGDIAVYHSADDVVVMEKGKDYESAEGELVEKYDVQSGYWWIELGGDWNDIIKDAEDIRWELYRTVYGIWDHIKNGGDHGAENYELLWVGNLPGIRESRRVVGEYVLTEDDILSNRIFPDAVAYGGWPMDNHTAAGFRAKGRIPSTVRSFEGLYSIPYGCYVSKDVDNLYFCGRIISASKQAMGSTRVMGTCAVGGQAAGTAAALAVMHHITPHDLGVSHIEELRQRLLRDDCYIPGARNDDPADLARTSRVSASSSASGYPPENVISGVSRTVGNDCNLWVSGPLDSEGAMLGFHLAAPSVIHEVRITFDPDLNQEKTISVAKSFIDKEETGVPRSLVKDYEVVLLKDSEEVAARAVQGNHQRLSICGFDGVEADQVVIRILSTNGDVAARVYEVRIY